MKNIHLALLALLLGLTSCKDRALDLEDEEYTPTTELSEMLHSVVEEDGIPGIIVAIIDSENVRIIDAAGVRKQGSEELITSDDLFHIGSCTKAMTGTLMATLVDEGLISWETTLLEAFPELEGEIHEEFLSVTLQQFLTHTSGVPANAADWSAFADLELQERRIALIKENLQEQSEQGVGEFLYSNLGYLVAGSMAEKVTGKDWETLMQERIFNPLEMTSAGFGIPGTVDQADQPWGHTKSSGEWDPVQFDNPQAIGPAGVVHCSFEDWGKFIRLQLPASDPKILNREQLNHLIDPTGDYAAGWAVVTRGWAEGKALFHNGSNLTWYVVVWVAPELNRAYMVGLNSYDDQSFFIADKVVGELIQYDLE